VVLAIGVLALPLVKVNSTEEEESEIGENPSARDAFRRLQLQDEDGQIPPNALIAHCACNPPAQLVRSGPATAGLLL